MLHKIKHVISISSFIIMFFITANSHAALESPHDSSNSISCDDCHSIDPASLWGFFPRDDAQETMCKSCHNPTGQAASLYNVGNHIVNSGAMIVDCGSCHNPHYPDRKDAGMRKLSIE